MTHLEQALALYEAGNYTDALPAFRLAVKDDPLNPRVWYHAAVTALELRDFRFAISLLQAYTRFVPNEPKAHLNLGHAQFATGEYAGALASYERATVLRPDSMKALVSLGHLSRMLGREDDAARCYERLLAIESAKPGERRDRALVRLALGDHERGWAEFESRLLMPPPNPFTAAWRAPAEQRWDGRPVSDRPVCLYNLRGNGDTILFARYVGRAATRATTLLLMVQPGLRRLLAPIRGVTRIVESPGELPPDTLYADFWSLPHLLGPDLMTDPDVVPYLTPPAPLQPMPHGGPLRVGITWAGHPDTLHDPDRSVPRVDLLAPLFAVPGVEWTSLQVGDRANEAAQLPIAPPPPVTDFADTAGVIAGLDLVIAVDTAVANLAGALGLHAWVLVPTYPEPRWGLAGESTPWYPTLRLFRRAHTGEWAGVIARVAAALAGRATEHAG